MYSGYGGSPSRTLSTMSLSVRPVRCINSRSITRSQSFTGFNTHDKPYRSLSVFSTPSLRRKPSRASRLFTMSTKSTTPPKIPQPERLDEVYEALKKGLQSYLQIHQSDLDSLSRQIKESKRNSRLGFLYELDKQIKVTERFIRRLEFHLSKIEELYEAYCLQKRLRDGADKLVKAYTGASNSKWAKESLAEASKGYKEYTENMCVLESDLENQLGEFHVKMKGLAGFARLCAGDQYEIFMKYGRQRWKLRGRIEINAKQVWDSEDMVFLPLISDFLSVKVTELKSLANHVVVGSVCCETKDLFAALPQTVAVDINDLGTIKLSLEVTWSPFDKDEQGSVASINKPPTVSKRLSAIFNHSPPDTPSLREQAFYNMLRLREELENGAAWSNSSESSDDSSSPQLSAAGPRSNTHHTAAAASSELQPGATGSSSLQPDISFSLRDSASSTPNSTSKVNAISHMTKDQGQSKREEENGPVSTVMKPVGERVHRGKESSSVAVDGAGLASCSYSRSLSLISESSADGVVCTDTSACRSDEETHLTSRLSTEEIEIEMPNGTPQAPGSLAVERVTVDEENATTDVSDPHRDEKQHGKENMEVHVDKPSSSLTSAMFRNGSVASSPPATPHVETSAVSESLDVTYAARRVTVEEEMLVVDSGLEDALGALVSSLDDYRGQFPELQLLEQELKLLQVTLKGGTHSRSPSVVSLTVETALGSFDFLNTSDCEEEEEETGEKRSRSGRSLQDARRDGPSSPTAPLTTGCPALDCSLVVHLKNCSSQLLRLGTFGPLRCGEMFALDRLLREAGVLQIIRRIAKSDPSPLTQPAEVVPELERCRDAVSLWQQCVQHDDVFSVSADRFVAALSKIYSAKLPERAASMADAVFLCVVERVLDQRLPRRCSSRDKVTVTVFQLWSYLQANGVYDMDAHVTELANEVWLVQILASREQEVIVHALRRSSECRLQREGLHAVAKLLRDPSSKVSAAAISVLRSLASQSTRRETAVVSCLELLEDQNLDTRVCGCKALACLKAKESIEQLVYLCRTDKEEVRDASKQALLVLGEEGKMAFRHVETSQDSIPRLFAPGSMASTAF